MQTVTVTAADLLAKTTANRTAHLELYTKAEAGYRKAVIDELEKMLADAREGKPIRQNVHLPVPENHTEDYDRIITMLKMSVNTVVELTNHDFDQFVMDNWAWSRSASVTNFGYANR